MQRLLLAGTFGFLSLSSLPLAANEYSNNKNIAKEITVRIEGATQGSGVILSLDKGLYTVLTAWHVLASNRKGEEIDIVTHDGDIHEAFNLNRSKIIDIDIGTIQFRAEKKYTLATPARSDEGSIGSKIFVSGFPLPEFNNNTTSLLTTNGEVVANASLAAFKGYQLLYSNPTWPGMSGGPVLNTKGELIGIHGKSRENKSNNLEKEISLGNGINEAVPIRMILPKLYLKREIHKGLTLDDYILLARQAADRYALNEAIFFSEKANSIQPSFTAYTIASFAYVSRYLDNKNDADLTRAISSAENAILIKPFQNLSHLFKCQAHFMRLEDKQAKKSCLDFLEYSHPGNKDLRQMAKDHLKELSKTHQ